MSGTDWTKFRVETISLPTFLKRNLIHAELLAAVARRSSGGVLEVGVGSGAQSALLSRFFRTVTIDNDPRILRVATGNLSRFGPAAEKVVADGFRLPFRPRTFGVAVSQGLMEHFDDAGIASLLNEQLRVCESVVFSVPSDNYPRQDVGDERLLSPGVWRGLVRSAVGPAFRTTVRYYRFDLERIKYSLLARRSLGGFNVLVMVDPR